jgi:RNA polymerase sigma-70 factor, ECF subfamily
MIKTDEQLASEYLAGNEAVFEQLVERYLKWLYNFVFQLTRDKAAAEDIMQDVFVKVWKNLSSFDTEKKFSTWIFAIAKNTAYDFLKKKKSIPFSTFENEDGESILEYIEDETILHSHELLQKMDNTKDVQELLASLPVETRTILLLHYNNGFSLVEIAEILGHPSNTVKSRYRRAIMQLREQLFSKNTLSKAKATLQD